MSNIGRERGNKILNKDGGRGMESNWLGVAGVYCATDIPAFPQKASNSVLCAHCSSQMWAEDQQRPGMLSSLNTGGSSVVKTKGTL